MTPYDAVRATELVGAKLALPLHWDNWGNTQVDPMEVVEIAKWHLPDTKVVIPQWGVKWLYPLQADIKRMKYSDWRERYRPEYSWEYGEPARKAAEERGDFIPY
jgi:hypothetical protein